MHDKKINEQKDINLSMVNQFENEANKIGFGVHKINQNHKAVFTQTINDNLEIIINRNYLTNAESTFVFNLMPFVELHSNAIVNKRGQFMSISELAKTLKRERTRISKTVSQLLEKGVLFEFVNAIEIKKHKRNISQRPLFMNPEIIFRGNRNQINATLAKLVMEFDLMEKHNIRLEWKLWIPPGGKNGKLYRRKSYLALKNNP